MHVELSAVAPVPSWRRIRVARFRASGIARTTASHVHDLSEGWGIEGLIGLTFLRRFNYEIRSAEG